jgi:two-component system, sensor histidine kinase and response regulator
MRNLFTILVLIVFVTFPVLKIKGQEPGNKQIDSLFVLLNQNEGKRKVDLLNELSRAYWNISLKTALDYSSKAYNQATEINYFEGMSDAANRIGNIYYFLKDTTRALDYYQRSLELAQTIGSEKRKGVIYNNIGLLYASVKNQDKAIQYYTLGLESKIKYGDKLLISSSLHNLGNSFNETGNFNKALDYFSWYIKITEEIKDSASLAQGHELYGYTCMRLLRYDKAFEHHSKSYDIRKSLGDSLGMTRSFFYIGQSLLSKNNLPGARVHFNLVIESALKFKDIYLLRDSYRELSILTEKEKDFNGAYQLHLQYSNLNDSILKMESERLLGELKIIYETESTDKQAEILAMENEIQTSLLKREANLRNYLLVIVLLIIIIAFIILSRFFLKQRLNNKLKEKIKTMEDTYQQLKNSETALQTMNVTKDKFFGIIAHDLKNPFNALMGFSEMLSENLDDLTIEEMSNYVEIIHNSAKNLYRLLENLLLWSASQTGNISFAPENFDLRVLSQKELALQKTALQKKKIVAINKIAPGITVYADTDLISKTFYNLLDNAIKFSPEGGTITLSAVALKKYAEISIADSGPGMSEEQIAQLFRLDNKPYETTEQRGTGLGLILCKYFVERNSGFIDVISSINRGTTFIFSIPLAEKAGK